MRSVVGVAPPTEPNTTAQGNDMTLLWLAPNEWLLIAPPDTQRDLRAAFASAFGNLFAAVTDVTSGYATLEIKGDEARHLLARGCGLDLHPSVFGPGQCAQTLLAKASVIVVPLDATPGYHVIVRRSMAAYLWRWLDDAAADVRGHG